MTPPAIGTASRSSLYDWFAVATVLAFWAGCVDAQTNGSSFSRAADSQLIRNLQRHAPTKACDGLSSHEAEGYRVTSAVQVEAHRSGSGFCRVRGTVLPQTEFVLDLPHAWNGRMYVHGNGGYGGQSPDNDYGAAVRAAAIEHGFAAGFSDLGHDAARWPGASWAHDNREAELDFSYRALHRMTVAAKALAGSYYAQAPVRSYFEGCSTGGGQGLKAASLFPGDFDGIAIGAPVFDFIGLQLYGWVNQMAIAKTPLRAELGARLGRFILHRHDHQDGLVDGVISNPASIDFSPARDLPRAGDGTDGFSAAEIDALEQIYRGPTLDGTAIYPGIPIGAEPAGMKYQSGTFDPAPPASGWATRLFPDAEGYQQQRGNVETWLKYLAFRDDDPDYNWQAFDIQRDLPELEYMAGIMDVRKTDLSDFQRRNGRILMYHGWADTGVNPHMTLDYYQRVWQTMGPDTPEFFRLFMVPGMFHCRGGLNVDRFDVITPLIEWVESGVQPEGLIGARIEAGKVTRTRPLCAYPEVARYRGSGDPDVADSFRCIK